jgi:hypothetical protein
VATCSIKEALCESVRYLRPFASANDPSQLPRRGRRKHARLLFMTPESQLDVSAPAWSLLAEAASYYGTSHDGNFGQAILDGTTSRS